MALIPQTPTTQSYNTNLAGIQPVDTTTPATVQPPAAEIPSAVANVPAPATPVTPREVTAPETVSGQLTNLLNQDNPYITSARNRGMETANSRGLINSSIAAGTAERAAIDAALPVAQQDASVSAQSGLAAQQLSNDVALTTHKGLIDSAQQRENFGYRTAENAQNIAANTDLQNARIALDLSRLDETQRTAVSNAASPIIQQMVAEISRINSIPDKQMSPEDKQIAIDNLRNETRTSVNTMASLYGYQLSWE